MPVRLVTVWSSEHHVDEALAFASADVCGDLVEAVRLFLKLKLRRFGIRFLCGPASRLLA